VTDAHEDRVSLLELAPLGIGVLALVVATAMGWNADALSVIVAPPALVRIALASAAIIVALLLIGAAVARMEGRVGTGGHLVTMLRGIRLAFLALAAVSVAIGWLLGSALPFVVALIIAGIDVIETSFLLVIVRREGS
jgi:hypothetical protein